MSQSLLYTAYAARTIKNKLAKGYSFQWFEMNGVTITDVKVDGEKVLVNGVEENNADILLTVIERMGK